LTSAVAPVPVWSRSAHRRKPGPTPRAARQSIRKRAVHRVVRLVEVEEDRQRGAPLHPQEFREELKEPDVIGDPARAEEACLRGVDGGF
jgi:hypothetical protein